MTTTDELSRVDYRVLFWVVGSRRGATLGEIVTHESYGKTSGPERSAIEESLARLSHRQLIEQQGERYVGEPRLHAAFLAECRNCRDTLEEVSILERLIRQLHS